MASIDRTDSTHDNNGVNNHPQYKKMMEVTGEGSGYQVDFGRGIWDTMLDCLAGERQIKSRTTDYLPMTEGMKEAAENGSAMGGIQYRNYLMRACYPESLSIVITAMQGLLFAAPVEADLPGRLIDMIGKATVDGMSLDMLARQVSAAQMTTGRIGLLLDPQDGAGVIAPKIAVYTEKSILNWGEDDNKRLVWVVLDESRYESDQRTGIYCWKEKYRVLAREIYVGEEGTYYGSYYTYTVKSQADIDLMEVPAGAIFPDIAGSTIDFIPFQIINSSDISNDCSVPMMMPVANISLAIFRNSADYELALFQTAQPTPFISGATASDKVAFGANRLINIQSPDAKAEFLEISGAGIEKQRQAILDKAAEIGRFGVDLVENGAESGAALNTRLTIKTASLKNIALTLEAGIKSLLQMAAEWCGYNPDDVVFVINKEYKNDQATLDDLSKMKELVLSGMMRMRDMWKNQLDAGWTSEGEYETWREDIAADQSELSLSLGGDFDVSGSSKDDKMDEENGEE